MRVSESNITSLSENEVFVFGSNLSGIHGGGAARIALQWGAEMGNGVGMQGSTYAIPTKSEGISRTLTVEEIKPFVDDFITYTIDHPELKFLVTEIGCGLAGHIVEDIAPLFSDALNVENVYLPERFVNFLLDENSLPLLDMKNNRGLSKEELIKKYGDDKSDDFNENLKRTVKPGPKKLQPHTTPSTTPKTTKK